MSISEKHTLRIRPHHGLCIAFFRGEGYSSDFTANMTSVIARLNDGCAIQLTSGDDCICSACPNNCGGICASEQKVQRYDARVLALCGIKAGVRMEWNDLADLVRSRIIDRGLMNTVCGDCEWAYICHNTQ